MTNNLLKFTLPSILIIITGIIGLIKYFFYPIFLSTEDILIAAFNLCFFVALGLIINKNYKWTKYLILVLAIFGLINFPAIRQNCSTPLTVISLTFITQRLLLLATTIILFKPFKTKTSAGN